MSQVDNDLLNFLQLQDFHIRVKLSKDELTLGVFLLENGRQHIDADKLVRFYQCLICDTPMPPEKTRPRIEELCKYRNDISLMRTYDEWMPPDFPINGYDLIQKEVPKGVLFTKTLQELRQLWKESYFKMTKEDLLAHIDSVYGELKLTHPEEKKTKKKAKKAKT